MRSVTIDQVLSWEPCEEYTRERIEELFKEGQIMLLYKVLKRQGERLLSPFQDYEYPVGEKLICENFNTDKTIDCAEGFYATDIDGLIYAFRNLPGYEVWLCEVGGRSVEIDQFKRRYETIELLERIPNETVKKLALAEEAKVSYKLVDALFPVHPFKIKPPEITDKEITLVRQWDSVGASVWASVGDSVGASVWASVWASVGASVWASVGASVGVSVWASVGAYTSSLFPNIKKWECIEHEEGINPFQPAIDLWHMGLVPSYDGEKWRLNGGKDGKILWEGEGE